MGKETKLMGGIPPPSHETLTVFINADSPGRSHPPGTVHHSIKDGHTGVTVLNNTNPQKIDYLSFLDYLDIGQIKKAIKKNFNRTTVHINADLLVIKHHSIKEDRPTGATVFIKTDPSSTVHHYKYTVFTMKCEFIDMYFAAFMT